MSEIHIDTLGVSVCVFLFDHGLFFCVVLDCAVFFCIVLYLFPYLLICATFILFNATTTGIGTSNKVFVYGHWYGTLSNSPVDGTAVGLPKPRASWLDPMTLHAFAR